MILDQNPGIKSVRSISTFNRILTDTSLGTSPYHSLQVGFEKRYSHGLSLQSNFTWSKVIDLAPTGNVSFSNGLANPFDLRFNRGISDLNVPLISVTNFVYTTPALHGWNSIARSVLAEWQLSTIFSIQTGRPFGISGGNGNNNSGSLQNGDRANVTGVSAQVHQGDRQNWLNHYVNAAAFTTNPQGTFGNSGRNIFTQPAVSSADMGISKNVKFSERYSAQLRWEMFNALNHTSFGGPNTDPTSSQFGQITGIGPIAPRVMQGGAKFSF